MVRVRCQECRQIVRLPNGLALSGKGENPGWNGVSCPWCYERGENTTIPVERVKEAFHG